MALADYYRQYNSDVRLSGEFSGVIRGDYVRADLLSALDAKSKRHFAPAKKFAQLKLDDSFRGLDVININSASSVVQKRGATSPASLSIHVNAPQSYVDCCPLPVSSGGDPDVIISPSLDRTPKPQWVREVFESRPWCGWSSSPGEVVFPGVEPIEVSAPSVSIVVPIFNKPDRFVQCLESVRDETIYPRVKNVYIVDDGSDEYSSSLMRSMCEKSGWTYLTHENKGYLLTANRGIGEAFHDGADYVISLNSDVLVTRGWLSGMVRAALRNNAGLVNPLSNQQAIISLPMSLEQAHGMRRMAGRASYISAAIASSYVPPKYPDAVTNVGNCLLIERSLWQNHGPFDEDVYGSGYGEECELWARARNEGIRCVVADDVYVYHESHGTIANASQHERDGMNRFLERWRPLYMREQVKMRLWDKKMDAVRTLASNMMPYALPVRFLCYNIGQYGGVYCVVRLVNELTKRGFCASVEFCVHQPNHFRYLAGPNKHNSAGSIRALSKDESCKEGIVVATHWFTGELLMDMMADDAPFIPLAFWQDREDLFVEPNGTKSLRSSSIKRYPEIPNRVVNADWVGRSAQEDIGISAYTHIPVGVDCHKFYPGEKRQSKVQIVAMYRPTTPRRGGKRLQRLYAALKERYGEAVSLETFGEPCSFADVDHKKVSQDEVAAIMRTASIVVEPSDFQGFGLPGLEGMASGCALVSTDNLGIHEYGRHSENCFIANRDADLLGHLYELVENPSLCERIGREGRETALTFDWSVISDRWADHLLSLYSKSGYTKY